MVVIVVVVMVVVVMVVVIAGVGPIDGIGAIDRIEGGSCDRVVVLAHCDGKQISGTVSRFGGRQIRFIGSGISSIVR